MTLLELEKMGCLFRVGSDVKSADQDKQGRVRILYLADIGEFNVRYRTQRFLTYQKAKALKCIFLKPGDILIARCPHPLGRTSLFEPSKGESVTIGDVLIFRNVLKQVDPRYLCYYLNSPIVRAQINRFSKGSFRDRISKEQIGSIKVHLPAIETQRRIALEIKSIFGECDSAIAEIQKTNRTIEHYRESILNSAIRGRLVLSNNLMVSKPDESLPNMDMPFALPPTWTWVRLGQLLLSFLNPCVDKSRHLTSDIQMLGIDYIRANAYNFSPIEKTNKPYAFEPHLESGDLLFYCSNHKVNLKRCIVFKGDPALVHCQHDLFR
ncbi:MAG TPA: restriction endonuclease subunit S, partial [Gammaproteobacteria bacterium]|nr:restriction endonuclease subunit S [Gammaproteobacteria bacterium]